MDAASIDVQVLSLTAPGVEQLGAADAVTIAQQSNNFLAAAISHYLSRLAAFAAIPAGAPAGGRHRGRTQRTAARP